MPIKQLIEQSQKNQLRAAHLVAAISERISSKMEGVSKIMLSESDTIEFLQLFDSVKYVIAQQDNVLQQLVILHAGALKNYQECVRDGAATVEQKLEMMERLLETALSWVSPDVLEYLRLRKETILLNVVKSEK